MEKLAVKAKKIEEATKPAPKTVKKEAVTKNDNSDKENQKNNARFEGKRVLDARKAAGEGPREERNNLRNQDGAPRRGEDDGEGRGRGRGEPGARGRGESRGGKREYE